MRRLLLTGAAPELACLRSAAAMPSDRTPELSTMLEAAQLADQLDALLPLDADGTATLRDSPAARQRALRAMLKASDTLALPFCVCATPAIVARDIYMTC